jgi:hypothetical protein
MVSRVRQASLFAAALVALFAAHVPFAPIARAQSAEERASARALLSDADKRAAAGDYPGAVDAFTKAYAFIPAPTIKVGRAHALIGMGRLIEAQQDLLDAAHSEPRPGEPAVFAEARRKAAAEADALTPRLPALLLGITGAPADKVTLSVDGQVVAVQTLGAPRVVNPGTHSVRAEAEGYTPVEQVTTVHEGDQKTLTFALSPEQPAPPPPPAATPPTAPPAPFTSPAPTPMVMAPAYVEPPNNTVSTLGWVGTGVFAGAGIITGLVALEQAGSVKSQCKGNVCPTSTESEASMSSTLGNVSTITFIAAGGCLLLGILTHHSAPTRTAAASSFDVEIGPGSIGASGRF